MKNAVADKLHVVALNVSAFRTALSEVPYQKIADIAIVPMMEIAPGKSIYVTYNRCEGLGLEPEWVLKKAIENSKNVHPPFLWMMYGEQGTILVPVGLNDEMPIRKEMENRMFILSNLSTELGAGFISDKEVLDKVGKKFGGNYYIIPSSVNELLLVVAKRPEDGLWIKKQLKMMNRELRPEEHLSDNVFLYDREARELRLLRAPVKEKKKGQWER